MTPDALYRVVSARMPHHAGRASGMGTRPVPATSITDPGWLRARIGASARLYGCAPSEVLGTIWWYSVSSVLVAPALEALVLTGTALDPSLEAVTLDFVPDGRLAGARSARVLPGGVAEVGAALATALDPAIETIASVAGARSRALHAIATDSIANRLLWAGTALGDVDRATALAEPLVAAMGERMPRPRYVDVGSARVVRRGSCCLIYEATGGDKCASCPRQRPEERLRRLRRLLG